MIIKKVIKAFFTTNFLFTHLFFIDEIFANRMQQNRDQEIQIVKKSSYADRELPIEKLSKKKFNFFRRVYQNTTVKYNYIVNCRDEIEDIVEKAKEVFVDNYNLKPLSFFDFSHDFILKHYKARLDSILMRLTSAFLLHDLRNKWVDEIYLMMGKAFFYKQDYDSAFLMFKYIDSRFNENSGNNVYVDKKGNKKTIVAPTIVNKEQTGFINDIFDKKSARNDALIWLIRVHIEREEFTDASIIIDALDKDIFFPVRLVPFYEEVKAHFYYEKKDYIQSAQHLVRSMPLSKDRQEKARKSFLIAQLYNLGSREDLATQFVRDAIKLTYDPVLEIYSRMNFIMQEKHPNIFVINDHLKQLLKLLKRERFKRYKDLIYYAASFMSLKKK